MSCVMLMKSYHLNMKSVWCFQSGPTDHNESCQTCGLGQTCPGHMGHITLPLPMYNPVFFSTLYQVSVVAWLSDLTRRLIGIQAFQLIGCFTTILIHMQIFLVWLIFACQRFLVLFIPHKPLAGRAIRKSAMFISCNVWV
jgi:hypothetical protein